MKNKVLAVLFSISSIFTITAQNYNSNINQNQVIINNQSVQERIIVKEVPKYIEKKEYIYVKPPKQKLTAPVNILGNLWIYPEDLGSYPTTTLAQEVIDRLNSNNAYGHSNWRLPTLAELSVMQQEEYAYKLGIEGEYIYNGWNDYKYETKRTLRPVAEQKTKAQLEKERELKRQEEAAIQRSMIVAERMRQAEIAKKERFNKEKVNLKLVDGVYWSLLNLGATNAEDEGSYYTSSPVLKDGYRFPTKEELKKFITGAKKGKRISPNGYIITIYSKGGVTLVEGTYLVFGGYKYNTEGRTPSEECMVRMVYNY
ncbi:MAG: hypothetical protein IKU59_03040 [Bacteroidales bacterium]|nr:hypothetical protein [Bacteroidales bacterium]